jgi:hypothetical protein
MKSATEVVAVIPISSLMDSPTQTSETQPLKVPPAQAATDSSAGPVEKQVFANLAILTAFGASIWLWVLYHTDWVPFTGGLLGLGGLVAWVSLISNLLDDEQKAALRQNLARWVLEKPRIWLSGLVSGLGILFLASFGSVEIKSFEDARNRVVSIRSLKQSSADSHSDTDGGGIRHLAAHSERRVPVWTRWFGRTIEVRATGLPALRVRVRGLQKLTLVVPDDFVRRPVVLIRPTARMSVNAEQMTPALSLVVCRNDELLGQIASTQYRGQTVWVGCRVDVEVPMRVRERWQLEATQLNQRPETLTRWTLPLAVGADNELALGDRLRATLIMPDGTPYAVGEIKVDKIHPGETFVQELHIQYMNSDLGSDRFQPCPGD